MKIYRVTNIRDDGENNGYSYFASKSKAKKEQKEINEAWFTDEEITEINFQLSKKEIVGLLNLWASYPDNG